MGVVAENGKYCFDSGLVYVDQTGRTINETYTLPTGKRSEYVNKSNERTFVYKNAAGQLLKVVCRAYDDGVAFRYELGNQEPVTIRHELTECILSDETHTWMMDWIKDYENFYPERVLDTITRPTEFLFPVLTLQDKQWMLMTEAEVYSMPCTCQRSQNLLHFIMCMHLKIRHLWLNLLLRLHGRLLLWAKI